MCKKTVNPSEIGIYPYHFLRGIHHDKFQFQRDSLSLEHPNLSSLLGGSSQDLDTWLITMVIVSPVVPLPNGL